jgi:hypothetical protein
MAAAYLGLAHAGEFDGTHPLSLAMRDAVRACVAVDRWDIDDCGTSFGGSPEMVAARAAVMRLYIQREAFVKACDGKSSPCDLRLMGLAHVGITAAWEKQAGR